MSIIRHRKLAIWATSNVEFWKISLRVGWRLTALEIIVQWYRVNTTLFREVVNKVQKAITIVTWWNKKRIEKQSINLNYWQVCSPSRSQVQKPIKPGILAGTIPGGKLCCAWQKVSSMSRAKWLKRILFYLIRQYFPTEYRVNRYVHDTLVHYLEANLGFNPEHQQTNISWRVDKNFITLLLCKFHDTMVPNNNWIPSKWLTLP